jgi:hypothetical protein
MATARKSDPWAIVGDAGYHYRSEVMTYMATREVITTAIMYAETTSSVLLPAVERKNKESSLSCKETKMNTV